jgi:malate dehydrogenase (oxaloacetate-decarboxylating)(NADP+)
VQKPYAHPHAAVKDFAAAIESIKPTAIIGVSTVAKAFNQQVVEGMARLNRRPVIFSLSNPTSRAECSAEEAYRWSEGRAIFAGGSPFPAVRYRDQTFVPGQCNNMYIFPAIGLAVYATRARRVTREMFIAAAQAVAEQVTAADLARGLIYPPQSNILGAEVHTAQRVAELIFASGFARLEEPKELDRFIESQVYTPEYRSLI